MEFQLIWLMFKHGIISILDYRGDFKTVLVICLLYGYKIFFFIQDIFMKIRGCLVHIFKNFVQNILRILIFLVSIFYFPKKY